ncbi:MAG: hypothetical protein ABJH06_05835 [Paraglaciecola sp.]|uniref:Imm32 family immunity protein n=1 Tax=Paraglaciecola sp. TaxID=1920173 RepID=UPI003297F72E
MKEIEFNHNFIINQNGIPFSEKEHDGSVEVDIENGSVYISGDKSGLLALASKIIEVAHCEVTGFHKHLDEVEIPNVVLKPDGLELNIGKSKPNK